MSKNMNSKPGGNQPRRGKGEVVAGRSAGGEWTSYERQVAAFIPHATNDTRDAQWEFIRNRITEGGAVPATSVASSTNPRYTEGIDTWWDEHYKRMEQKPDGRTYAVLPDDYTPSGKSGHAISGKRRTHRMRYSGAGVDLRMPSATAIRRFAKENNNRTFDLPIEIAHEGGTVSGFVRVTPGPDNTWEVQALNFPGKAAGRAQEAVACVLEARRPTLALKDAERQYEAQREAVRKGENTVLVGGSALQQRMIGRMARAGVAERKPATRSSLVKGGAFDAATNTMTVNLNGRRYGYRVSRKLFEEVMNSPSPGHAYNLFVKGKADRVEIENCDSCGRWFKQGVKHVCPPKRQAPTKRVTFRNTVATKYLMLGEDSQKTA